MNNSSAAISLTVDRSGIIDLLAKTQQAIRMTAGFMHSAGQVRNSIMAELIGAYIESLAVGWEKDLDLILIEQLQPLVLSLAQAGGEDDLEETAETLAKQLETFKNIIKQAKATESGEEILIISEESGSIN